MNIIDCICKKKPLMKMDLFSERILRQTVDIASFWDLDF